MANSWLRLWHDMPNDPKWRTISRASKQPIPSVIAVYLHLLVNASNATERGRTQNVCSEDIASALDLECEQVEQIIAAMQGRVLEGEAISGWKKRQVEREDGGAERAKAWREAQKAAKEAEKNEAERNRTQSERNQTPDKDTDTEYKTSSATDVAAVESPPEEKPIYSNAFIAFWELYPKHVNKGEAAKAFKKIRAAEYPAVRAGLERKKKSQAWLDGNGKYIPHASKWLNARGWEDEDAQPEAPAMPAYRVKTQVELDAEKDQRRVEMEERKRKILAMPVEPNPWEDSHV